VSHIEALQLKTIYKMEQRKLRIRKVLDDRFQALEKDSKPHPTFFHRERFLHTETFGL
jgi:hypothetical protein